MSEVEQTGDLKGKQYANYNIFQSRQWLKAATHPTDIEELRATETDRCIASRCLNQNYTYKLSLTVNRQLGVSRHYKGGFGLGARCMV